MDIKVIKDNGEYNSQIYSTIINAFKQDSEANLVKNIKKYSDYYISYIALDDDKVVGHVMISPMLLNETANVLALAPVSVLESYSNHGIGSRLIRMAIKEAMISEDYDLLSVLGSDHYYSRFGFEQYDTRKFELPFEIEKRYFQLLEIKKGVLKKLEGKFTYPEYFIV